MKKNDPPKDLFGHPIQKKKNLALSILEKHDKDTIHERLKRQEWIRNQQDKHSHFLLTAESSFVLSETWSCFINREYIATLFLATSFIEYHLCNLLSSKGYIKEAGNGLKDIIKCCKKNDLVPTYTLSKIDYLRKIRNPFVHLEAMYSLREDDKMRHRISERIMEKKMNFDELLEHDAKEAIQTVNLLLYGS